MGQIVDLLVNDFVGISVVQVQVLHILTKSVGNKYGVENYTAELRNSISTDLDENKGVRIAAKKNDE